MRINLFLILLALCVAYGIKAVWTMRLPISARRQIVGSLARKLGWCLIATPLFAAASIAGWIGVLRLMDFDETVVDGQGTIWGIVFVLLALALVASHVRRYAVPIPTGEPPLDWTNVDAKSTAPRLDLLGEVTTKPNADDQRERTNEKS